MLKNYFKLAWRNLWKYKAYSLINICGLSLGLACCLLITLYLKDEWSFDRFHREAENLYRINSIINHGADQTKSGRVQRYLAPVIARQLPVIRNFVRLRALPGIVRRDNEVFLEQVTVADESFFSVFSFPLVNSDPRTALDGLQNIVLTREMAIKYFGREDIAGEILEVRIYNQLYRFVVSAVAENVPANSSVQFDIVISTAMFEKIVPAKMISDLWILPEYTTFLLLEPGTSATSIISGVDRIMAAHPGYISERAENDDHYIAGYDLQPLTEIHLHSRQGNMTIQNGMVIQKSSRPKYGYILLLLAGAVMLIACMNYINLSLSQAGKRKREIGVRKTLGSGTLQLGRQFGMENLLVIVTGTLLAFLLVTMSLPWFNQMAGKALRISYFADWRILFSVLGLLLVTVIFTSLKPALFAIRLNTVGALQDNQLVQRRGIFARSLVIGQFFLATTLIIAAWVINVQSAYWAGADLGYDDKDLLVVELPPKQQQSRAFKEEIRQYPQFGSAALGILVNWMAEEVEVNDIKSYARMIDADEDFLKTLDVPLKAGRALADKDDPTNVLVNETFVQRFGLENPLGQRIQLPDGSKMTVVGIVRDYHYADLRTERIMPLLISSISKDDLDYDLYLRLASERVSRDLPAIAAVFRKHFPDHPFNARFQEDINRQYYQAELRWQKIVNYSCAMAIFIACCGLLGLSLLAAQSRTKEIGIRKVLGAPVSGIVALLSGNFIKPVLFAVLLAIPLAWYIMHRWLENYAYRISLQWWMFALAGLLAVVVALLTVSFQSVKAALANPADSLRNE